MVSLKAWLRSDYSQDVSRDLVFSSVEEAMGWGRQTSNYFPWFSMKTMVEETYSPERVFHFEDVRSRGMRIGEIREQHGR